MNEEIERTLAAFLSWCEENGCTPTADGRVPESVTAELLGVSAKTLSNWRGLGCGPKVYRVGGVSYRLRDLAEFVETQACESDIEVARRMLE